MANWGKILLLAFLLAPLSRADEPIDYHNAHFDRFEPDYRNEPVFTPGDKVRLNGTMMCIRDFRILVEDPELADDLGNRPPDVFKVVEDDPEKLQELQNLLNDTFPVEVRIVGPGTPIDPYSAPGFHEYPVRIERVEPYTGITNPSPEDLAEAQPGQTFIIRGVLDTTKGNALVAGQQKYHIEGNVRMGSSQDPEFKNDFALPKDGDEIQVRVIKTEDGTLRVDQTNPGYIFKAGEQSKAAQANGQQLHQLTFDRMRAAAQAKDYKTLRAITAEFARNKLAPAEAEQAQEILNDIPFEHRPIWIPENQYAAQRIRQEYLVDITKMTRPELMAWAEKLAKEGQPAMGNGDVTSTGIFDVLEEAGVPVAKSREIAREMLKARNEFFKKSILPNRTDSVEVFNFIEAAEVVLDSGRFEDIQLVNDTVASRARQLADSPDGHLAFAVNTSLKNLERSMDGLTPEQVQSLLKGWQGMHEAIAERQLQRWGRSADTETTRLLDQMIARNSVRDRSLP